MQCWNCSNTCLHESASGWNDEFSSGVAAHTQTSTQLLWTQAACTVLLLLYSTYVKGTDQQVLITRLMCTRTWISCHKWITIRQSKQDNSGNFTNSQIMLNNKYNNCFDNSKPTEPVILTSPQLSTFIVLMTGVPRSYRRNPPGLNCETNNILYAIYIPSIYNKD